MTSPLVSVVVPVYNGAKYLAECLESLLAQDYPRVEVIVVDDGSNDDSAAIAEDFPVHVLRRSHAGVGATRNAATAMAAGDLIGFCDADDLWKPHKARVQVDFLQAHPEIDVALCRQDTIFEPGVEHPDWLLPDQVRGDLDGVSPTSALFRRRVFERVQYRTDMPAGGDFNLLIRARTAGFGIAVLEQSLRIRRIHADNTMHKFGPALSPMFETVREHLRDRR